MHDLLMPMYPEYKIDVAVGLRQDPSPITFRMWLSNMATRIQSTGSSLISRPGNERKIIVA
jgi:hypothetical protein